MHGDSIHLPDASAVANSVHLLSIPDFRFYMLHAIANTLILVAPVLNALLQMLYVWHWAECLQEAGAGTGHSVQRNGRVPGRRREAAAKGTLAHLFLLKTFQPY